MSSNVRKKMNQTYLENENSGNGKQNSNEKNSRLHFIITNKKNSSWIDDLDSRDKNNSFHRTYH